MDFRVAWECRRRLFRWCSWFRELSANSCRSRGRHTHDRLPTRPARWMASWSDTNVWVGRRLLRGHFPSQEHRGMAGYTIRPVRTSFLPAEDACASAGWHAETTLKKNKNTMPALLTKLVPVPSFILHHNSDRRLLYFEGSAKARTESPLVRSKKLPPVSTITTYCFPSLPIKVEGVT